MLDLTFGEQVKIVLSRKGMTIKELAENIEERAGRKMSRQNLTQRLGRDNFQEKDMRMIAEILGCPFQLSILVDEEEAERVSGEEDGAPTKEEARKTRRGKNGKKEKELTIGDYMDMHEELSNQEQKEKAVDAPRKKTRKSKQAEAPAAENTGDPEAVQGKEQEQENQQKDEKPSEPEQSKAAAEGTEKEEPADASVDGEHPDLHRERKQGELHYEHILDGLRSVFQRRNKREHPESIGSKEAILEEEHIEKEIEAAAETMQETESVSDFIEFDEPEQVYAEAVTEEDEEVEDPEQGEINPYTGHEYESNSVRMHPKRIGYVQVYDRRDHAWTDMTEWAFLGYQERKKALLGKDYEDPIYLD